MSGFLDDAIKLTLNRTEATLKKKKKDESQSGYHTRPILVILTTTLKQLFKNKVPQVRLELTASAFHSTVYKYGALTDCATGAGDIRNLIFAKYGIISEYCHVNTALSIQYHRSRCKSDLSSLDQLTQIVNVLC